MSLDRQIESFLSKNQEKAQKVATDMQAAQELVLYGETHVGLDKKADFFAKVMRAASVRYHASEHFINTKSYGRKVDGYLKGKHGKSGLPSSVRSLTPILDYIKGDTAKRGLVFSGSREKNDVRRHGRIYANFQSSRSLHLKAGRFGSSDRGMFHIGAFHAARLPQRGSTKSTTQLLIAKGLGVGVVRIMVDVTGGSSDDESGAMVITAGEASDMELTSGGGDFDLLPILRKVAGGNAFGADITTSGSPFFKFKPFAVKSSKSFADYYDRLIFLP